MLTVHFWRSSLPRILIRFSEDCVDIVDVAYNQFVVEVKEVLLSHVSYVVSNVVAAVDSLMALLCKCLTNSYVCLQCLYK